MNETEHHSKLEVSFTFRPKNKRKNGTMPPEGTVSTVSKGSIPRISRLLALAIHFDTLIRQGEVHDYADLARLGYVTRARISQIMNLLNLAPDIQEDILHLPNAIKGRDPIVEKDLRPVTAVLHWQRQRKMWAQMRKNRFYNNSYRKA